MLNPDLQPLDEYTFARLNAMLAPIAPKTNRPPVLFSIGEPQNQPPAFAAEVIAKHSDKWNKYPPPNGDEAFRRTVARWLTQRFDLAEGMIDPDRHVVPVAGTREPLYQLGFLAVPEKKAGARPAILMPNPFYHSYRGAAMLGRAEPVYLDALPENDFLPDLDALTPDLLARTAIFYLCTPSNPQGTVADLDYLKRAVELARAYDFLLAVDECYAEIHRGTAPAGGLSACAALGGSLDNVVVLHSLSKRSSAPGMRSGFIAGDERLIKRYGQYVTFGGAPLPLPILHASTALWADEAHVEANRAMYDANFRIADRLLGGRPGFRVPPAGFFLWLDVGDAVAFTERLWREEAIKLVPGGLMGRPGPSGENPGDRFVRVALVYDAEKTEEGLSRLAAYL